MPRPTVARIDLDAVIHNVHEIKRLIGRRKLCAVVKADAYGHGANVVSLAMDYAGADMFAVAMTEEAVELRQAGVTKPIILLTPVPEEDFDHLLRYRLTACIAEEHFARKLAAAARRRNTVATVHVNVDTGMRRTGIHYPSAAFVAASIANMPGLQLTGIFTHFACADSRDLRFCRQQLKRFRSVVAELRAAGVQLPLLHVANSGGVTRLAESYFDCVRPGLILYGLYPAWADRTVAALRPVLSLRTAVVHRKEVAAGETVGYGQTFTAWRDSVVATLPVGYHDGYPREFSNAGEVLVRGKRAPVIGRVCMDQTLVDCTDISAVAPGDEAVIYGSQQGTGINIEEMAQRIDRIPYELTCAVGRRVRREFVLGGSVIVQTPLRSFLPESALKTVSAALQRSGAQDGQKRDVA